MSEYPQHTIKQYRVGKYCAVIDFTSYILQFQINTLVLLTENTHTPPHCIHATLCNTNQRKEFFFFFLALWLEDKSELCYLTASVPSKLTNPYLIKNKKI